MPTPTLPVPVAHLPKDRLVLRSDGDTLTIPEGAPPHALIMEAPPLLSKGQALVSMPEEFTEQTQTPLSVTGNGLTLFASADRQVLFVLPHTPAEITTVVQQVGSVSSGFHQEVWHWLPGSGEWTRGQALTPAFRKQMQEAIQPGIDSALTSLRASLARGLAEPIDRADRTTETVEIDLLRLEHSANLYIARCARPLGAHADNPGEILALAGPLSSSYLDILDDAVAAEFEPDEHLTEWASAQRWEVVRTFLT